MVQDHKIWVGSSGEEKVYIYPKMANRHGMIAGATGTGKTVTLKVLAESFSSLGVPVFLADVKGDLAGMCRPGEENEKVKERMEAMKLKEYGFDFQAYPVTYWDVYGEKGMPLRTTISEMGPLLLSRILELNETQSDILTIIFKIADDEGISRDRILFDIAVQSAATDSESALISLKTIKEVKEAFTGVMTVCGLSNASFGLPKRININSAYLTCAIYQGLDAAIMDNTNPAYHLTIRSAEVISGRDDYCMEYITYIRENA